jgi:hypothetical protein
MIEFMRGIRTPLSTTSIPASLNTASNSWGKLAVPIPDQQPRPAAGVFKVHDQVLRRLHHPGGGRMRGRAQHPDPAASVFDQREHVHVRSGQGDRLEEACRKSSVP